MVEASRSGLTARRRGQWLKASLSLSSSRMHRFTCLILGSLHGLQDIVALLARRQIKARAIPVSLLPQTLVECGMSGRCSSDLQMKLLTGLIGRWLVIASLRLV